MGLDDTAYAMYSGDAAYVLEFFEDERGRCEVQEYLDALKPRHRAKAVRSFAMLKQEGPNLARPHADLLKSPVRELRVNIEGHQHRFLYVIHGKTALITSAFLKKTDAVPGAEIVRSWRRYADWVANEER